MDEKDFKSLALVRFERAKELYMEAYLAPPFYIPPSWYL